MSRSSILRWILLAILLQNCVGLDRKAEDPEYIDGKSVNPYSARNSSKTGRASREATNAPPPTGRSVGSSKQKPVSREQVSNVLINNARSASPFVESLAFESTRLRKGGRALQGAESQVIQQVHQFPENVDGAFPPNPTPVQQHYQCDSVIHDERFQFESPFYPSSYPTNRQCRYYVAKSRPDVCQLEVTIQDMDIEDTLGCTGDYLDLGGVADQRLCGMMMRGTKRYILFPSNNTQYAQILFNSDQENRSAHRGFSAEIRQLPNSCYYPQQAIYGPGTPQQVFHTIYGQRINPPTYPWAPTPPYANGSTPLYPQNYPNNPQYPQQYPFSPNATSPYYPSQYPQYSPYPPNATFYPQYPMNGTQYPPFNPQQLYPPPFYARNGTQLPPPPFYNPNQPQTPFYPPYNPNGPQYPLYNRNGSLSPQYSYAPNTPYDPRYSTFINGTPQYPYAPNTPYDPRYPHQFVNGTPQYPYAPNTPYDPRYPPQFINGTLPPLPYDPRFPVQRPEGVYPLPPVNKTPVYLASYCDIFLGELNGELRSPGYPFGYPTNHTCIYTIKRLTPDVCQVELLFHHLDIQTQDKKKDLTDQCEGDYLELPDRTRMCGYYNQAMSKDTIFKKYYNFGDNSDYLLMQFLSDNQQIPDGGGFWIEVRQIPHTCRGDQAPGVRPKTTCDRLVGGSDALVHRLYSPNYPQFYPPNAQCFFMIKPFDASTCEFEVDLVNFELEAARTTSSSGQDDCRKDFLELPDRTRICGHANYRRIFPFPKYHDRTAMLYFSADDNTQNRGFEVQIRQIPNSCKNGTFDARNPNQNVYEPTPVDPNIPFNPTPVFSWSNSSGFDPLNPQASRPNPPNYPPNSYRPPIPVGPIGVPNSFPAGQPQSQPPTIWSNQPGSTKQWGLKRGDIGPTYTMVADPRNVDHSGTVPLYFSNGSLATRVPPLRPVDMIPFIGGGRKGSKASVSAAGAGPKPFESLREVEFAPRSLDNTILEPASSMMELQPSYGCDQTLTRPVEYIRSPNFPSQYPSVSRCIYTIRKADNSVCQVRLQILSLDLEYTPGCKNDYVHIQSTNERLCGRASSPETRLINYFGHSRDIRVIFNSDRQNTGTGFEIRVEQVLNSCGDLSPISNRSGAFTGRGIASDLPTFHDAPRLSVAMAQAMPLINGINANRSAALTAASTPSKICRAINTKEGVLESEAYPNSYPTNLNCQYKIVRANPNVCRLEIEFLMFETGNSNSIIGSNGACPNDFLEIDSVRYCGRQSGQHVAINFPRTSSEVALRFLSVAPGPFPGFRLRIRQVDENCASQVDKQDFFDDEFNAPIIETCSRENEQNILSERVVRIQSPKFGLKSGGYDSFLECDYTVQRYSPDVCGLQIKFETFAVEESRACQKDFFEIGNQRLCGKMAPNLIKTYDFFTNKLRLRFHSDADRNDAGFTMTLKQIRC